MQLPNCTCSRPVSAVSRSPESTCCSADCAVCSVTFLLSFILCPGEQLGVIRLVCCKECEAGSGNGLFYHGLGAFSSNGNPVQAEQAVFWHHEGDRIHPFSLGELTWKGQQCQGRQALEKNVTGSAAPPKGFCSDDFYSVGPVVLGPSVQSAPLPPPCPNPSPLLSR